MEERPPATNENDHEDSSSEKITPPRRGLFGGEFFSKWLNSDEVDSDSASEKDDLAANFNNIIERILPSDDKPETDNLEAQKSEEVHQAELKIEHETNDDLEEAYFEKRHEVMDEGGDDILGTDDDEDIPVVSEPTPISSILAEKPKTRQAYADNDGYHSDNHPEQGTRARASQSTSWYRQSVQAGFIIGVLFIIFGIIFVMIT